MRLPRFAVAALVGLAALGPAEAGGAADGWVRYSAREGRLRIVFELKGHRLAPALLVVPLVCTGERRSYGLLEEVRGRTSPITVDRDGRFREQFGRQRESEFRSQRIVGRVTSRTIEGRIAENMIRPAPYTVEECHSGRSLEGPLEELVFRAHRVRSGS